MSQIQSNVVNLIEPKTPTKVKKELVCPNAPHRPVRNNSQLFTDFAEPKTPTKVEKELVCPNAPHKRDRNDHDIWMKLTRTKGRVSRELWIVPRADTPIPFY